MSSVRPSELCGFFYNSVFAVVLMVIGSIENALILTDLRIAATHQHDLSPLLFSIQQKERDLELAARIGQSLLKKNRTLTEQNDYLEERVAQIAEEVCRRTRTHSAQLDRDAQFVQIMTENYN